MAESEGMLFSVTTEFGVETPQSLSIEYSIEPEEVVEADPDVQCKSEDWQWDRIVLFNDNDQLRIEGSTTCASGFVTSVCMRGRESRERLSGLLMAGSGGMLSASLRRLMSKRSRLRYQLSTALKTSTMRRSSQQYRLPMRPKALRMTTQ